MHPASIALDEYRDRQDRVRAEMERWRLDVLVLTTPENIHYLTGYQTEGLGADLFMALPAQGMPLVVTRNIDRGNLLAEVAPELIAEFELYADDWGAPDAVAWLLELFARHGVKPGRVGVERDSLYLTVTQHRRLEDALAPAELVDAGAIVDQMRWIKSERELALHRAAGRVAVKSMEAAVAATQLGRTDAAVAGAAIEGMIAAGGEWVANWPHIRTGRHSGLAHRTWQHVAIERAQPTVLELCGVARRYHSPIYRTVIFGPTTEQRSIAAAVSEANRAGRSALRPGATTGEVFAVVEKVVKDHGHGDLLASRSGYMVGIAFQPNWIHRGGVSFVRHGDTKLRAGMVFHFLTLLLMPNEYGIGESSTMAITEGGCEDLTSGMDPGPFLHD